MADLRSKLEALAQSAGVSVGVDWKQRIATMETKRAEGAFEVEKVVPGEVWHPPGEAEADDPLGFYLVREEWPLDAAHGNLFFGDLMAVDGASIAFSAKDEELISFNPETTFFVDTETTGLMGGTGTMVFLMGIAYIREGKLRLDQCFLRDFDDEEPMLHYLRELFRGCETVVSYNGKSFDLPLLRTRFIQNRIPFPLDSVAHYDLLHAARRFWKRRLQDCSLTNIERNILGVERHGDVPSALIPQLWLDYLRKRDARPLEPVFYHHKTDILSLVTLTAWVARCLATPNGGGFEHAEDRLSLARLHFQQRQWEETVAQTRLLLATEQPPALRHETLTLQANALKKLQRWPEMGEAWALLHHEFPRDRGAALELAKFHEHRARDLGAAANVCSDVIEFIETREALGRADAMALADLAAFKLRLARIQGKLHRSLGNDTSTDLDWREET